MPTEADETTALPHTPPLEAASSLHASCPPEQEIEAHAPRAERVDSPSAPEATSTPSGHETLEDGVVEADAQVGSEQSSRQHKRAHTDDVADSPSSIGSSPETASDSDGRLARSMVTTALAGGRSNGGVKEGGGAEDAPSYIRYPSLSGRQKLSSISTTSFLHPGSKFRGTQQSDRQVYDVQVEIKDVDLAESFLCGYLRIQGLTDDHPTLTTFFTSEIIGPRYTFLTAHPSWNSTEKIDLQHWSRFPAFRPLARTIKSHPNAPLPKNLAREHLFMRWKEYFLVPDHRVKSISGASFEGFYYICFDQRVGSVSGIYFHAKSEKFQQLELRHVSDGGCVGSVEFR